MGYGILRQASSCRRPSAKVTALCEDLKAIRRRRAEGDPDAGKCVVFSQFTAMLDLIEIPLKVRARACGHILLTA
jgi:SNF2 family DNA or RNA helicase